MNKYLLAASMDLPAESAFRNSLFRAMHNHAGKFLFTPKPSAAEKAKYPFLKLPFAFTHCIAEPGPGFEIILEAFAKLPQYTLVAACNWTASENAAGLYSAYSTKRNIILINSSESEHDINILRGSCFMYIHGCSSEADQQLLAGAMLMGLPVICYYSIQNKTITANKSCYFSTAEELKQMILTKSIIDLKQLGIQLKMIAGYAAL